MHKIYLVDDDENILTSVSIFLENEGYDVRCFHDGVSALEALNSEPPDLAVFDVKMPRMDGIELLRRLRQSSNLPVIFLTSKDDELDEAIGFSVGADDYITKPFSQRLLGERIKAVLRRASLTNIELPEPDLNDEKVMQRGKLTLDPNRHACSWDGTPVRLTVTEFLILESLARRPGFVKSRDQLMDAAYDDQIYVDDRTIDSHIKRLRKKFRKTDKEFDGIETRLTRVIFLSHLFGLVILTIGSLTLNRYTQGLIEARTENIKSQALLVTSIMADTATGFGGDAKLDIDRAKQVVARLDLPNDWRLRLHDTGQNLIIDSERFSPEISVGELPPIGAEPVTPKLKDTARFSWETFFKNLPWRKSERENNRRDLPGELRVALEGKTISGERYDIDDRLIVTVSTPVMRVREILGVVTLESYDVEHIVDQERLSLLPFIGWAIFASLLSSIALTMSIVFPLRDLSRAAEIVARTSKKIDQIPDFSYRKDEIGDLSLMLGEMTRRLYSRIDDIANFAADVAHEIKNPLTSMRSASDTLQHAKTDEQREKLINIIKDDVGRMDRLITDISKASKVDANLAREKAELINLPDLIKNVSEFYLQTQNNGAPQVEFDLPDNLKDQDIYIRGFETPFAQVLRNLVDNAITFSPKDGSVRISLSLSSKGKANRVVINVDDDGPGIPPDNLETVFDRFYTERPKGAQFGSHSGLGLAICRQIITAHKGFIFAENRMQNKETVGARFVVNLPLQS